MTKTIITILGWNFWRITPETQAPNIYPPNIPVANAENWVLFKFLYFLITSEELGTIPLSRLNILFAIN
jgi:hypothetical protein